MPFPREKSKNTQFKKGVSGNLNGRRPKLKTTLKNIGYTLAQVEDMRKAFLTMTPKQLAEIANKDTATILEKILINALKTDLTKGQMNNLVMIEERAFGKPKEKVESTSNVTLNNFDITKLVNFVPTKKSEND